MNENNTFQSEIVQKSATTDDQSRHAGSIPAARSPSESSTYAASVEPSVANVVPFFPKLGENGEIATEAGHWYLPDGTPYYTTPRRSGPLKGQPRPVSLRHDRALMLKLGVVPSSTGITRQLAAPALNAYRERQIYLATLDLIVTANPPLSTLDEKDALKLVRAKADEHRDKAAQRGTSLHTAIEDALAQGTIYPGKWDSHLTKLFKTLDQYGIDLAQGETERSFAHPLGYGGKCDYHERDIIELGNGAAVQGGIVIDFKSKDEIELDEKGKLVKPLAGDEHAMQIASYAHGLGIPNARGINVFVGENDERIWIHEWSASDLRRGWELFQLLLRIWKIKNNYYPNQPNR